MTRNTRRAKSDGAEPISRALWIFSPSRDLLLFVATPFLILPVFLAASSRWGVEEIALFVFAFGQLGHNLPGMMRAYGDRELFQRHKIRFIAAPLLLLLTSAFFIRWDLHGLILVSAMWGIWHALMQTYGMLRIYDAKANSFAKTTQRLDLAMCLGWFVLAILLSPGRMVMLLDVFHASGGTTRIAPFVRPITLIWAVSTVIGTLFFVANLVRSWKNGRPPSPVKLGLMATSLAFYWFTNVAISNVLLGLAMFEVFHDVQYLAIVWVFNRNRVDKGSAVGSFTRFLFRRSSALVGLYLGLIFAYGSLYYLEAVVATGSMKSVLTALLATSGLLHYYYDGFIWKLRDKTTRTSLQIADQGVKSQKPAVGSLAIQHAMKWAVFIVPVCWLGFAELQGAAPEIARMQAIRDAVPSSEFAHQKLGSLLQLEGKLDAAAVEYRLAIECDPTSFKSYNNLGLLLIKQGDFDAGLACYRESLRIHPDNADAHNNLGNAYADRNDFAKAQFHFSEALKLDPKHVTVRNNLALCYAQAGMLHEAEEQFRRALQVAPNDSSTHFNFGSLLVHQRKFDLAAEHYRRVLEINPKHETARRKLSLLSDLGKRSGA